MDTKATLSDKLVYESSPPSLATEWLFPRQPYRTQILESCISECARRVCIREGIDYDAIPIRERFLLTRIRCTKCGMRPLYMLDLQHLNKVKCMRCSYIVNLRNKGKYGRIRKQVALECLEMIRSGIRPM